MAEDRGLSRCLDKEMDDVNEDCLCTSCEYCGINEDAEQYCVECREYFCGACFKEHAKLGVLESHHILDRVGMSALGPQQTSMVPTERCRIHNDNTIHTYCPVHQAVGCGTCVLFHHSLCKGIAAIPNAARGFKKSQEYQDIITSVESSLHQLVTFKETIQEDFKHLDTDKDSVLKQIKDFRKSVETELDRMERKVTDDVHTKCIIIHAEINANIKCIDDMMSALDSSLKKLQSIKGDNDAEIFICYVKEKHTNTECDKLLQRLNDNWGRESFQFKQNLAIAECMKQYEKLGELLEDQTTPRITNKTD